jgi:hypothetical protein
MRIIYETVFGSHLYGTDTPKSDQDYKGIYMPSAKQILLGNYSDSVVQKSKSDDKQKNSKNDIDKEYYSFRRFLQLTAQGQIAALEVIFSTDPKGNLDPTWRFVYENRERLFSKQCTAFIGYCRAQASMYSLKGGRVKSAQDVLEIMDNFPTGSKMFELIEEKLFEKILTFPFVSYEDIEIKGQNKTIRHLNVCGRKIPFTVTVRDAISIIDKLVREYGLRAKEAATDGVDWKAVSHAIRIGEESLEFLTTKNIVLPRPNAAYLLQVKRGELDFGECGLIIDRLVDAVIVTAENSGLPETADYKFIENIIEQEHLFQIEQGGVYERE